LNRFVFSLRSLRLCGLQSIFAVQLGLFWEEHRLHPYFEDYLQRHAAIHRDLEATFVGLPQQALDWRPGDDMNSLTAIIMHIVGVEHFLGGLITPGAPPLRNPEAEFGAHGMNEIELMDCLADSRAFIQGEIAQITIDDLEVVRIMPRREIEVTVGWAMLHVFDHTTLHLGHAQMTRQLWEQRGA